MKKSIFLNILLFVCAGTVAWAAEKPSTEQLLFSYMENDTTLKNLTIEAKKAGLTYQSTEIDQGFDVTLSTGQVTLKTVNDNTSLSIKPSASVTVPQVSNLTVKASSDINATDFNFSDKNAVSNTQLQVSVDIISENATNRTISLLKAERTYTEAKRKLESQAIKTETQFYTELKALLTSTTNLITQETKLYSDSMDFESTKAKGYSSTSSTYRLAQMKVVSDQHEIESLKRSLVHDYSVFYLKCGYEMELDENTDFFALIPEDIPGVEALDITSFDSEKYTEIESAVWTHNINSMSRKNKKAFTLSANGGYTLNNTIAGGDTVDAGVSSTVGGLSLSAGINVPVTGDSKNPTYTFAATLKPTTFSKNKITEETDSLNEEQELLQIENARSNYEKKIVDSVQNLNSYLWNQKSNKESFEMYETLAKELKQWFQAGIITESEYLSAETNAMNYKVKLISNQIDLIIYNNDVKTMFVTE